jgi:hypothetical protein
MISQHPVIGQVMNRALIEIKDGDHRLLKSIREKTTVYKLTPIAYKVDPHTRCWICLTATGHGYPEVRFRGTMVRVSRLIYEEFTGIAPEEKFVLHKCDNPRCINPGHLYLGTAKENTRDLMERGKSKYSSGKIKKGRVPWWKKKRFFHEQGVTSPNENKDVRWP